MPWPSTLYRPLLGGSWPYSFSYAVVFEYLGSGQSCGSWAADWDCLLKYPTCPFSGWYRTITVAITIIVLLRPIVVFSFLFFPFGLWCFFFEPLNPDLLFHSFRGDGAKRRRNIIALGPAKVKEPLSLLLSFLLCITPLVQPFNIFLSRFEHSH